MSKITLIKNEDGSVSATGINAYEWGRIPFGIKFDAIVRGFATTNVPGGKRRDYYADCAPEKVKQKARSMVARMIRQGKMKRGNCEKCGDTKPYAHHVDYYDPLNVMWLCQKCHIAQHKKEALLVYDE